MTDQTGSVTDQTGSVTDQTGSVTDQTGSSGLGSSPALSPSQSADDEMIREDNSRLLYVWGSVVE